MHPLQIEMQLMHLSQTLHQKERQPHSPHAHAVSEYALQVLDALQIREGATHGEVILTADVRS